MESHKTIVGLLILIVLITTVNLTASFAGVKTVMTEDQQIGTVEQDISKNPSTPIDSQPTQNTDEPSETPSVTPQTRTYSDTLLGEDISFQYLNGWHMYVTRYFDTPNGTVPNFHFYINETPVRVTSPAGGRAINAGIVISTVEKDSAVLADTENLPAWQSFTKQTMTIAGKTVTSTLITTDMNNSNVSYEHPFHEIIYVPGEKVMYRIEHIYGEANEVNESAWKLLKDTFSIR